jgi:hypothetical protein
MRPDVLAARINLRVAELRLLAAATFVRQSPRADLLAPPDRTALPHRGVTPPPSTAKRRPSCLRPSGGGRSP